MNQKRPGPARNSCLSDVFSEGHLHHVTCRRGLLVSVEGISGVGKTYLTNLLGAGITSTETAGTVMVRGFSQRASLHGGLRRALLRAGIAACRGGHFLRGG